MGIRGPPTSQRCKTHPGQLAGWSCPNCSLELCPDCVGTKTYGAAGTSIPVCMICGRPVDAIRVPRSATPFLDRIPGALVTPLSASGLVTIAVAGLMIWGLSLLGRLGVVIANGIAWSYVFSLTQKWARGADGIEPPDFSDASDVLGPALRALLASFVWLPVVIYFFSTAASSFGPPIASGFGDALTPRGAPTSAVGGEEGQGNAFVEEAPADPAPAEPEPPAPEPAHRLPVLVLLLALGLALWPVSLLIAATSGSVLLCLHPLKLFDVVRRLGWDYFALAGAMIAVGAMGWAAQLTHLIPWVGGLLGSFLVVYCALVMGRVLGLCLYVRGADLGYLPADEAYEPFPPELAPRGDFGGSADRVTEAAHEAQRAPIELLDEPAAGDPRVLLQRAIEARNADEVVRRYPAAAADPAALAPDVHLQAGKAAASRGDNRLAIEAFRAAVALAPQGETAPSALMLMARVYADRLDDQAAAQKIYRHVADRFPASPAAKLARERIA